MNPEPQSTQSSSGATIALALITSALLVLFLWNLIGKPGLPVSPPDYGNLPLEDGKGQRINLTDCRGPIMLNFFTTWCDQCETMAPMLTATSKAMSNDVQIVGVSLDLIPDFQLGEAKLEPGPRTVEVNQFVKQNGVDYPILFDRDGKCADVLDGYQVPVHVVFDSNMNMLRRFTGKRSEESLRAILRACVEEDRNRQGL
jgi:thiol-disulfide isomerase/thioredoxin